jgi:hypothetical protein
MAKSKKEKAVKKEVLSSFVHVVDHVEHIQVREGDGEMYSDRGETDQSHSIEGIEVLTVSQYNDLEVGFEVKYDKDYYLLYALYSTGDSFGQDGGRIEFVDLYRTPAKAQEAKKRLLAATAAYQSNRGCYSTEIKNELDQKYTFHMPWLGYFERLEDLRIEAVRRLVR